VRSHPVAGSMSEPDYYEVLQLHPKADHEIVAQAYWRLARKYNLAGAFDASATKKLEELNEAFTVLGSPDRRADYDRSRAQRTATARGGQKRVTIEVSFWRLPAWQGTIAAIGTLALAVIALVEGASAVITLILAAIAISAALLPTGEEWKPSLRNAGEWTTPQERELKALQLQQSTSAILARWRNQSPGQGKPRSLAQILAASDKRSQQISFKEPPPPLTGKLER
jgi:curved DNA-binding protein CbpA